MSFFVEKKSIDTKEKKVKNKKRVPLFVKIIGSILGIIIIIGTLAGESNKTFDEITKEMDSKYSIDSKVEYMEKIKVDKNYNDGDLVKIENLYSQLLEEKIKVDKRIEIASMLPPRDNSNNEVAYSVIEYIKEKSTNLTVTLINGGNTLRLTNGLFFQDVRFKLTNALGQSTKYNSYFLINGNGYTSDSVVRFFETSNDFYDDYVKKNNIETAEDEVWNYYFNK